MESLELTPVESLAMDSMQESASMEKRLSGIRLRCLRKILIKNQSSEMSFYRPPKYGLAVLYAGLVGCSDKRV